jgi:uncharacterized protein with PIN domain
MYLDSAILVKLVIQEWDSEFFADVVDGQRNACSSELAMVECRSALLRKLSVGHIDRRDYSHFFPPMGCAEESEEHRHLDQRDSRFSRMADASLV